MAQNRQASSEFALGPASHDRTEILRAIPTARAANELKPSPVALALFAALERDGIRYCHWKSNIRLPETLSGLGDIDLLVHPADAHAFQRIISECGFKLTTSRFGVGHPGVFHAIALDPDSGRLLDLHAYHQMISGDSYVKSYRFAIEEEFLACTSSLMGVRVPEASAECLLFMLRNLLKHTSILEVRKVNAHSKQCSDELSWLLAQSDIEAVSALLAGWFPTIDIPVQEMIDCVRGGSVAARVSMGMRVAWALRRQRRIGHVAAAFSRLNRFVGKYIGRRRSRRNLSLLAGGAFIALAGPKGTGKSTLTKLLSKQLGSKLRVKRIHFGKPPASWATLMPRVIVAAGRKAFGDGDDQPDQHAERGYSTWFVISKYLVAIDRRRLLTLSMRQVASGTILISDRCHVTNGTRMDGSAFDDLAVERARSSFQRWLMERERAIYRCLPRPSLVLKLRVSLEKALERDRLRNKPGGPNPQAVQRRWARESESEFAKSAVCLIDVDGEIDDALRAVTACVWERL